MGTVNESRYRYDHLFLTTICCRNTPFESQLNKIASFDNKLLLEKGGRNGTVIRLLCPLIITQDECVEVMVRFKKAIAEALVAVRGA